MNLQKILIQMVAVFNLFTLEVAQKCQHCQLGVLRENSIGLLIATFPNDTCAFQTCDNGTTDCSCDWDTHCWCSVGSPITDHTFCPKGFASGLCPADPWVVDLTGCRADPGINLCVDEDARLISFPCRNCPVDASEPVLGPTVTS